MSIIPETFNETYKKPTNPPYSFDNLGVNIYKIFLLLIITFRFTCGKQVPKYYDHGGRLRHGTHSSWHFLSNRKHCF